MILFFIIFCMITIAVLWTSICFFYGIFLFIQKFFKKEQNALTIPSLSAKWHSIFFGGLCFFYVPFIFQKIGFYFLPKSLPQVDKTLMLAFIGEIGLLGFIIFLLCKYKSLRNCIYTPNFCLKTTLIQAFNSFCQCLPLLFVATILWQGFLNILIKLGLPITIDFQPIIQLLGKHDPKISSLIALVLCVTVLAPLCEEVFFRGILLKILSKFIKPHKALWIGGFIFAIAHQHFATLFPLMVLGYWLGLVYVRTNNLWVNIGIHSLFNGTNLALILLFK